jgi:hypothetical protein
VKEGEAKRRKVVRDEETNMTSKEESESNKQQGKKVFMSLESLKGCWWVRMSNMIRRHFSKPHELWHVGKNELLQIFHRYDVSAVGLTCCAGREKFTFVYHLAASCIANGVDER